MRIYHQCGSRYTWNLQSFCDDGAGSGLIFSPVNIEFSTLQTLDVDIRAKSFLDPQLYLPHDPKGKLSTYSYFPTNLKNDFTTSDFDSTKDLIADRCVETQMLLDLQYLVIPARYFDPAPTNELDQQYELFVQPFLKSVKTNACHKPVLLTSIITPARLLDDSSRNDYLNWVTGMDGINGVYLILPYTPAPKQIKDPEYLSEVLYLIDVLRSNKLEVHIGYTNTEGMLYSIAFPDSISFGSYENLRRFGIKRLKIQKKQPQHGPAPRLYSVNLLQWVERGYVQAMQRLYAGWNDVFADSKYKPLIFTPTYNWHFQKPELYKHFFLVYCSPPG